MELCLLTLLSVCREWVTRNFSLMQKMPPATKEAATEEMKKIIAHAYSTNTMLTTHWPSVQLTRSVAVLVCRWMLTIGAAVSTRRILLTL